MSRLSKIKERAAEIAARRNDDGRTDQEQARIERAKQEARRDAKREQVQERVEQAREQERERVMNDDGGGLFSSLASTIESAADAVDDGDRGRLDDVSRAFNTDFDGDGETLATEFGLQSAQRAEREDNAIQGLSQQVDDNTNRIQSVEAGFDGAAPNRQRADGALGGGVEPVDPEELGFGGGGVEPVDPEELGFGGFGSDR